MTTYFQPKWKIWGGLKECDQLIVLRLMLVNIDRFAKLMYRIIGSMHKTSHGYQSVFPKRKFQTSPINWVKRDVDICRTTMWATCIYQKIPYVHSHKHVSESALRQISLMIFLSETAMWPQPKIQYIFKLSFFAGLRNAGLKVLKNVFAICIRWGSPGGIGVSCARFGPSHVSTA